MTSIDLTRRSVLTGGAGLLIAGLLGTRASAGGPAPRLTLPPPAGPNPVGTVSLHLVTPAGREMMVSLWYPARHAGRYPVADWLAPGAAARFAADQDLPPWVILPATHGHLGAPVSRHAGRLPVVVYSPGNDSFRSANTIIVEALASHGYFVVTVDHTGDAYVEFPDGRVFTPLPDGPGTEWIAGARVADIRFVLDRLAELNAGGNPDTGRCPLPDGLRGGIDLHRVGITGYSAGGVTVAAATLADGRIHAGLSLDGPVAGPVVDAGLDRPYLLVTATRADRDTVPELAEFWRHLRGWKRNIRVDGVTHTSYSDEEALVPQLGLPRTDVEAAIGVADPGRVLLVQRAYPLAFFNLHLRGRGHLLDGPSTRFPEVRFVP